MDKLIKTINSYNKNSRSFHKKFTEYSPYIERINEFISLLKSEKRVLDLGCGPGNVLKQFLLSDSNWKIIGVGLSEEMLKIARNSVPEGEFICEDIRIISFPEKSFDVIILSFCIVHLDEAEIVALFQKITRYLDIHGKVYISFMEGKKDGFEKTSFSEDEIYFNYHTTEKVVKLLERNNFSIIKLIKQDYLEMNGVNTADVFIFAEKLE